MDQSHEGGPIGELDSSKAALRKDGNIQYINTGPIGAASAASPAAVLPTITPQ